MIRESKRLVIAAKLGFNHQIAKDVVDNKIWILARSHIQIQTIRATGQSIAIRITEESLPHPIFITAVYVSCFKHQRKALWDELRSTFNTTMGPWMVCGDFNTTISPDERLGGPVQMTTAMIDFQEAIHDIGLIDIGFFGSPFTWCNNRTGRSCKWARLDRILINSNWMRSFPSLKASWDNEIFATSMYKFFIKMKNLKAVLRTWNKDTFGDVSRNVQEAENEVAKAEVSLLNMQIEADTIKLNLAHATLKRAYLREEIFWK
ncbi:uncharacterized protein LOC131218179 [Magnolia sinica]|uniref:uncharacterized protein LOC131218179 n=1 Tax=Magnolia sinica TaxID=86752 RepID=UPI002659369A|nr:uncharacterized protein LOC131218179 [Magnolia sinica]